MDTLAVNMAVAYISGFFTCFWGVVLFFGIKAYLAQRSTAAVKGQDR